MTWLLGKTRWEAVDASDPRRVFATEVFTTVQARIASLSRNGTGPGSYWRWHWSWLKKPGAPPEVPEEELEEQGKESSETRNNA